MKRLMSLMLLACTVAVLGGCVYGPGYYQRPGVVYDGGGPASYSNGPVADGAVAYDDDDGYYPSGYYYAPGYGPWYGYGYGWGWPYLGFGFYGSYYHGGGHWHGHGGGWHGGSGSWHGGGGGHPHGH